MRSWDHLTPHPDVVVEPTSDGALVLHQGTQAYLEMNGTASFLWDLLARGASYDETLDALCSTYAIDREQAAEAADELAEALVEEGLVVGSSRPRRRDRLARWALSKLRSR